MKTLALLCCFAVSGCSVWMTNKGSPVQLSGCHMWPPMIDSAMAVGLITNSVMTHRARVSENKEDGNAYTVGSLMVAGVFAISALMGSGDYFECQEE